MKRMVLFLASILVGIMVVNGRAAAWDPFGVACDNASNANNSAACNDRSHEANPATGASGIILKAADLLAIVTGVAAVIAIMISGIRFITSSGDPNSVNGAKNTIVFAIIGLLVVIMARAIVAFILNRI